MTWVVFSILGLLVIMMSVAVSGRRRDRVKEEFAQLLSEGQTVVQMPSLETLLTEEAVRMEYAPHITAVGYNTHGDTVQRGENTYYEAQAYVVDDGGAIHVIERDLHNGSPVGRIETDAFKLAELLGVPFAA